MAKIEQVIIKETIDKQMLPNVPKKNKRTSKQAFVITGTVRDEKQTLPFANIFVSDANGKFIAITEPGTTSDVNGNFKLEVNPDKHKFITVRYLGYKDKTFPVSERINAILTRDAVQLPELIITAPKENNGILVLLLIGIGIYLIK